MPLGGWLDSRLDSRLEFAGFMGRPKPDYVRLAVGRHSAPVPLGNQRQWLRAAYPRAPALDGGHPTSQSGILVVIWRKGTLPSLETQNPATIPAGAAASKPREKGFWSHLGVCLARPQFCAINSKATGRKQGPKICQAPTSPS